MTEGTVHASIARMEAATWHLRLPARPQLPPFLAAEPRAVGGRLGASGAALVVLTVLGVIARRPVPEVPKTRVVIAQAHDAGTGLPVTRSEWLARAQPAVSAP